MNHEAVIEIWSIMKNYISPKDQKDAAAQYIDTAADLGMIELPIFDQDELFGTCNEFDFALKNYLEENSYLIDEDLEDEYEI